jgi:transcriptional regulator with XRE-family HTH domain
MNTLQERLSVARKKAGLTQSQLATRAAVSQSTIAQIESGRNSGTKFAFRLANALGVSVEWLLAGKGTPEPSTTREEYLAQIHFSVTRQGISLNLSEPLMGVYGDTDIHYTFVRPGAALFDKSFFEHHRTDPADCRLVEVKGTEMEPYLFSGDWVIINNADTDVRDGGNIFAYLFPGNKLVVREVSWLPDGGLRLRTYKYLDEKIDVPPEKIPTLICLGRVIYRSSPQLFGAHEIK